MDALQDFPLDEVRLAIKAAMDEKPGRTLNEREVLFQVHKIRAAKVIRPYSPPENVNPPPTDEEKARMNDLLASVGFAPKRIKGDTHE